jgi:hypothetical protein
MLSAWRECAARIECQLYHQEQGDPRICHQIPATRATSPPDLSATSPARAAAGFCHPGLDGGKSEPSPPDLVANPRVSPLGERRLVFEIFRYLDRWPVDMRCIIPQPSVQNIMHIILAHNGVIYVYAGDTLRKYRPTYYERVPIRGLRSSRSYSVQMRAIDNVVCLYAAGSDRGINEFNQPCSIPLLQPNIPDWSPVSLVCDPYVICSDGTDTFICRDGERVVHINDSIDDINRAVYFDLAIYLVTRDQKIKIVDMLRGCIVREIPITAGISGICAGQNSVLLVDYHGAVYELHW